MVVVRCWMRGNGGGEVLDDEARGEGGCSTNVDLCSRIGRSRRGEDRKINCRREQPFSLH
jgi:hypothetical protein